MPLISSFSTNSAMIFLLMIWTTSLMDLTTEWSMEQMFGMSLKFGATFL